MVRVIQPAGFTKAPLLRAGLIDGVDEVILLCTDDVLSDVEIERFKTVAAEFNSPANFRRVNIPAIGISASECMCLLRELKNELDDDKETWVSVRGSTNLLSNCMMIVFEDFPLLSIHPREENFSLSGRDSGKVSMVPVDEQWKLYGLQYSDSEFGPQLSSIEGTLIARPEHVELTSSGKIRLDWSIEQVANYKVERKSIGAAIGTLLSLNSINCYEINIPFQSETVPPSLTRLPPEINLFQGGSIGILPRPNLRYENFQMPNFPIGSSEKNDLMLHVCLNPQDITSTVIPIMLHRPDHVVIWVLPEYKQSGISSKQQGQLRIITEFLQGKLYSLIDDYLHGRTNWVEKGIAADLNFKCQIHLAFLPSMESIEELNLQFPICSEIRLDILPGFSQLHSVIHSWLKSSSTEVTLWYSQQLENRIDCIDYHEKNLVIENIPIHQLFPLRLLLVEDGNRIDIEHPFSHFDILEYECISPNRIVPKSGIFGNDLLEVTIDYNHYLGQYRSNIASIESELVFGDNTRSVATAGAWLELLSAHLIQAYWPESSVYEGVKCRIVHGEGRLGHGAIDFDILAKTKHGIIMAECKTVGFITRETNPEDRKYSISKFNQIIGQLMGHMGYVGHRKNIIPLIITSAFPPPEWYELAHSKGVVLCDWSELKDPDLIVDRWRNGTPPDNARYIEFESQVSKNSSKKADSKKKSKQPVKKNIRELLESTKTKPMLWKDFLFQREDSVKEEFSKWKEKQLSGKPKQFYRWLEMSFGSILGFTIDSKAIVRGETRWIIWNEEE